MVHRPTTKEKKTQKVTGVRIQNTVTEVQKVHQGREADPPGAGRTPGRTPGHEAQLVPVHGPGLPPPDRIRETNTVTVHSTVDHLRTLLSAAMLEDEPRGNLGPVGKKIALQIKGTAAALKRHFAINM